MLFEIKFLLNIFVKTFSFSLSPKKIVPFRWSMLSPGILLYLFGVFTFPTRDFLPAVYLFKLYNSSSENLCAFPANFLPPGKLYLSCVHYSPWRLSVPSHSASIFSINIPYPLVGSSTNTWVTAPMILPS